MYLYVLIYRQVLWPFGGQSFPDIEFGIQLMTVDVMKILNFFTKICDLLLLFLDDVYLNWMLACFDIETLSLDFGAMEIKLV